MKTAYDMRPPSYRAELTEVGRGTPMGELLRRYWHPVGLSTDAGDTPRQVRILGEDLVLFRDGDGRAGLLHSRCCHRGTTLYYGRVEDRGLRCCYHGWLFDVTGNCLEQPVEPGMGEQSCHRFRQPWYPVEERYGLIFAYMGPYERMPLLPRWTCLEELGEDEFLDADDRSIGSGGGVIAPCNWLQHFENVVDPLHVPVLHGWFSGPQFTNLMTLSPDTLTFETTSQGVRVETVRPLPDGRRMRRVTEAVLPTIRAVPNPFHGHLGVAVDSLGWTVPVDDSHYRIYTVGRVKQKGGFLIDEAGVDHRDDNWLNKPEEERRAKPGDWEAQTGQGAITHHSEEHLASSDRGIVQLRKLLYAQLRAIEAGKDPIGVSRDADAKPIVLAAGNWIVDD